MLTGKTIKVEEKYRSKHSGLRTQHKVVKLDTKNTVPTRIYS